VRALLDEQLSPQIAELLRQAGHDVVAVIEREDLAGRSDRVVFEVAAGEQRAVITNNINDFRPLAAEWLAQGKTHAGLILLPAARVRTRAAIPLLADAIAKLLRANPNGIAGSERWIGPLSNT
jgi:predicted nuclease of predicted toxin-antitoxin system